VPPFFFSGASVPAADPDRHLHKRKSLVPPFLFSGTGVSAANPDQRLHKQK